MIKTQKGFRNNHFVRLCNLVVDGWIDNIGIPFKQTWIFCPYPDKISIFQINSRYMVFAAGEKFHATSYNSDEGYYYPYNNYSSFSLVHRFRKISQDLWLNASQLLTNIGHLNPSTIAPTLYFT